MRVGWILAYEENNRRPTVRLAPFLATPPTTRPAIAIQPPLGASPRLDRSRYHLEPPVTYPPVHAAPAPRRRAAIVGLVRGQRVDSV
jgi:hypothetical protein